VRAWRTASEAETERVGESLAPELAPDGTLLLSGELGSGKTVLTRGLARGLGIDPREVQSPTFTLIREHRGAEERLVHVDLYRLEPEQATELGLEELLAGPGVKVVEWAERLSFDLPGALRLALRRGDGDEREIREIPRSPLI
jgi:tRNA threonylcarbamoyladenosine biosynthesis protein TsaE